MAHNNYWTTPRGDGWAVKKRGQTGRLQFIPLKVKLGMRPGASLREAAERRYFRARTAAFVQGILTERIRFHQRDKLDAKIAPIRNMLRLRRHVGAGEYAGA